MRVLKKIMATTLGARSHWVPDMGVYKLQCPVTQQLPSCLQSVTTTACVNVSPLGACYFVSSAPQGLS